MDMLIADRVVPTTCPYCGVGCQIDMHLKNGLIYRVNGRFDNDVNRGNLCVKGRFGFDYVHAPDRLSEPLLREQRPTMTGGTQAEIRASRSSSFVPASWPEALDHVVARFEQIRDQHGPDAIAVLTSAKCTNEENYLLQKLARSVIGTNNVDHCARL